MAGGQLQGSADGQARTTAEPLRDVPADAAEEGVTDDVVLGAASVPAKTANNIQMGAAKMIQEGDGRRHDGRGVQFWENSHKYPGGHGGGGLDG